MTNRQRSDMELLERWEDSREIRNLMGVYTQKILYKEEGELLALWSGREDIALGLNDGWYVGREAVGNYYRSIVEETARATEILAGLFPEHAAALSPERRFGMGQFDVKPISSDLVEIAEDRQTAQGMWSCQGSDVRMTTAGPLSYWTLDVYAVDFLREDGQWRIWHLLDLRDVDCPCGEKWWEPPAERAPDPLFAAMGDCVRPPFTLVRTNYTPYSPRRRGAALPPLPHPYDTFTADISYGPEGGTDHV